MLSKWNFQDFHKKHSNFDLFDLHEELIGFRSPNFESKHEFFGEFQAIFSNSIFLTENVYFDS